MGRVSKIVWTSYWVLVSQVLFWLLSAIDGHAKNFSIYLTEEGKYNLAPLYEIISVLSLIKKNQLNPRKVKMAMALRGKNKYYTPRKVSRRHLITTAIQSNFTSQRAEDILDTMA